MWFPLLRGTSLRTAHNKKTEGSVVLERAVKLSDIFQSTMDATPLLLASLLTLLLLSGLFPASSHARYFRSPSPPYVSSGHFFAFNSIQEQRPSYPNPSYHTASVYPSRLSNYENQSSQAPTEQPPELRVVKGRPTVRPARFFNPQQDADKLQYALKSFVNADVIIGILTNRSSDQRQIIMRYYPDLRKDLHWKLSFDFRDLMEALVALPQTYICWQLKEALRFSTNIDEKLLVELLGTLDNTQLRFVKDEYRNLYGRSLQDDMTQFSLDKFSNFFSSYIQGDRDQRPWVDQVLATKDAEALKKSGKLDIGNGGYFRYILTFRSFDHLNRTFVEYQRITHKSIEQKIKKDFSGKDRDGLLQIVKSIINRRNYFAEILHEGLSSMRTTDATLIRIIVLRSEIDMEDIKEYYGKHYKKGLDTIISSKTSGSFKKALLSLISG